MRARLAKARGSIQIFFPMEPLPGSPYEKAGRSWRTRSGQPDIRDNLVELLRSDPDLVSGYSLLRTDGAWFNENANQWVTDQVCMILGYVRPEFVAEYRDPEQPKSRSRRFLARIGQLSCHEMGHSCFWCIFDGKALVEISKDGMEIAGDRISFEDVLK
jgi:hypothetical protein